MLQTLAAAFAAVQSLTCMPLAIDPGANFAAHHTSVNTEDRSAAVVDFEVHECDSFSVTAELETSLMGNRSTQVQPVPRVRKLAGNKYQAHVNLADLVGINGCYSDASQPLQGNLRLAARCTDGRTTYSEAAAVDYAYSDANLFPYGGERVYFDQIIDPQDGNHLVTFGKDSIAVYDARRATHGSGGNMDAFRTQRFPIMEDALPSLRRGSHLLLAQRCLEAGNCTPASVTTSGGHTNSIPGGRILSLNLEGEAGALIEGEVAQSPDGVLTMGQDPQGRVRVAAILSIVHPTGPREASHAVIGLFTLQNDCTWTTDLTLENAEIGLSDGAYSFYIPDGKVLYQLVPNSLEVREIPLPNSSRRPSYWYVAADGRSFLLIDDQDVYLAGPNQPLTKLTNLHPYSQTRVAWTPEAVGILDSRSNHLQLFRRADGLLLGSHDSTGQVTQLKSDGADTFIVQWEQGADFLTQDAQVLSRVRMPSECPVRHDTSQVISGGRLAWLTASPPWGKTTLHWLNIP